MEVHAQVTSNSKLFSGASTAFGGDPNSHVSLVDAAMPGMLPVINEECVRQAVRTGLGLNARINLRSVFDRKNYLFSGPAAGLSDQPVQIADRRRGRGDGRTRGRQDRHHRHRAAASGAGRRQVAARPEAVHVLCRSQPLRRGADGDRLQAGHPRCRAGQGLCDQAAHRSCAISAPATATWRRGSLRADVNVSVRKPGRSRSAPAARSRT